ncbi:hypothetical protein KIH13_08695 [Pseudomonas viridiflava]|nr:hypothetical protein KIH13_08695 [Pseudomonas viridiflava]
MSKQWIFKNIRNAVPGPALAVQVRSSYSRHLFYTPLYHPSLSPKEHASARLNNSTDETHKNHKAFHYNDEEVKGFVNKRKRSLVQKYGSLETLTIEK